MLNAKAATMIFAFSALVKETQIYIMEVIIIGHNVDFLLIMMIPKKKFQKIVMNARSWVENKSVRGPKIW